MADADDDLGESNENNNLGYEDIWIRYVPSKPDLTVQNQTVTPATINAGQATDVSCKVRNLETALAGSSKLGYYLSRDAVYDSDDLNLGSTDMDALSGNSTSPQERAVLIPFDTPEGDWHILFRADADGTVAESNESNNVACHQIRIEESLTGAVNVTIEPTEAIDAGAVWRVVDWMGPNNWRGNGETETGYPPETYFIEFKDIPGWKKPDDTDLTILAGQTVHKTGVYIREDTPVKITLQCPNPDDDHCHRLCNGAYHVTGSSLKIRWVNETRDQVMSLIAFHYSLDGGEWEHIWTDSDPNNKTETYEWPIAEDFIHDDVRVKVVANYTNGGRSEAVSQSIRIIDSRPPVITVSAPADGQVCTVGEPVEIRWRTDADSSHPAEQVDLKFLPFGETIRLYGAEAEAGSYTWHPNESHVTENAQVRVTLWAGNCTEGVSESPGWFEIRDKEPACSPEPGMLVVGRTGQVGIDWIYDGGMYRGELGIFSLEGMDLSVPDMTAFIEETVRRVMSGAWEGHIVLSDVTDKARFSGVLGGEPTDWNEGEPSVSEPLR